MRKEKIRLGYFDKSFDKVLSVPAGEAHGLVCSPTRGGKFRDVLAGILMSFEGSCFVVDPKLQAASVTARYRRDVLKQDVYILNPFEVLPENLKRFTHAKYDPLRSNLDPSSPSFAADADNLVEGLMPYGGPETHWIESARQLASGVAMYHRRFKSDSLASVQQTISGPNLIAFCQEAVANSGDEFIISRLARFAAQDGDDNRGEVRSVISSAITQLGFIANGPITNNLSESTLDFRDMRKKPMTVYLGLPGRYLSSCAKWHRMIVNSFADACLQEGAGAVPILGILDEFKTAVGKLGSVETLLGMGAGYGCQLITVIRDIPELMELYPKSWESWVANSGFQCYFSSRDWTTSDFISRMVGVTEVDVMSKSYGRGSVSAGSQARRHMLPEEVREIDESEMLVFIAGLKGVLRAGRVPYYKDEFYAKRYDPDPYHP